MDGEIQEVTLQKSQVSEGGYDGIYPYPWVEGVLFPWNANSDPGAESGVFRVGNATALQGMLGVRITVKS